MDGILPIDKPQGWTSHDVVAKVRYSLKPKWEQQAATSGKFRVGHAGTLDPMATGLLILLIGKATKKQDSFTKLDKRYRAEVTLGASSSTDDAEGDISDWFVSEDADKPTRVNIEIALEQFKGEIEQIPPAYSAIKVDGQRAYKVARSGQEIKLKSRKVVIHSLEIIDYDYPRLRLECRVGSGTYIRSLARDLGRDLGVGGYLSGLRRTHIGDCSVEEATYPDKPAEELVRQIQSIDI